MPLTEAARARESGVILEIPDGTQPRSPRLQPRFSRGRLQSYRGQDQLVPGAVLMVGRAQAGSQIAEELYPLNMGYESGRRAGRTPDRGKDANRWFARLRHYDRNVSELPSPKAKFSGKRHISATRGGHTINLHQFARDGVTLIGRLTGVRGASSR